MKIRNKLLVYVLTSVLIILFGILFLSRVYGSRALAAQIEKSAEETLNYYIMKLDDQLNALESVARGAGIAVEDTEPSSEETVKKLILSYLTSVPDAYGSTVSFEPGTFSSEKRLVGPYYYRKNGEFVYVDLASSSYNYPAWEWYRRAVETGKPFWMEPYVDVGGGGVAMTTYSYPFMREGSVWGVATVDVSLSKLTDIVSSIKVGETGYAFLVSKKGVFLSVRKGEWTLKRTLFDAAKEFDDPEISALAVAMTSGENGYRLLNDPLIGKKAWFVYGPIPSTGWALAIVFPEDELLADITSLHYKILATGVFGAVVIFIFIFIIAKRFGSPVTELADAAKGIAAGDFSKELKNYKTKDEIGVLSRAFGDMKNSLSRMLSELRRDKETFEAAFSNMTDGLLVLNSRWQIVQSNRSAEHLLLLPLKGDFFEHIEAHFDSSTPLATLANCRGKKSSFKLSRREKEGISPLHLECVIAPICDESRELKEIVLSVRDVTFSEIEERSKRDFLSLMSHKLFTPLGVLSGKLMLMKDGLLGEMSEKQQKNVDAMVDEQVKLKELIGELVDFVTMEDAKLDSSRDEIDLKYFLSEIAKEARASHADKNCDVTVACEAGCDKFVFNKKYLSLMVGQLIDNGIKFNMSEPARIEVRCGVKDDHLKIEINDNGIGIPPEFLDRVFEKFFQIEKSYTGNAEGVGLGLVYVKKIAEYFGGRVEVSSQVGMGSSFVIQLPLREIVS